MNLTYTIIILLSTFLSLTILSNIEKDIKTKLYASFCTRVLDKNGRFGCASYPKGDIAELIYFESEEEIKSFSSNNSNDKYTVALKSELITPEIIDIMKSKILIKGILELYQKHAPKKAQSAEKKMPQDIYRPSSMKSFEWNPHGTSILYKNYLFSIVKLTKSDSDNIISLAKLNIREKNKRMYSPYKIKIENNMYAKTNSKDCLVNTKFCLPIGGYSVWSTYGEIRDHKIIVISTKMDDASLYESIGNNPKPGLSALLAAIHALLDKKYISEIRNLSNYQIVYAIFDGESFGFVGSRKFVKDIQGFNCFKMHPLDEEICLTPYSSLLFKKLKFKHIVAWIDITEIGYNKDIYNKDLFYYTNKKNSSFSDHFKKLISNMEKVSQESTTIHFKKATNVPEGTTPPSSIWSWLFYGYDIPGIVLSDHNGEYNNENFQSHWDRKNNLEYLQSFSTWLARLILLEVTNDNQVDGNLKTDPNLLEDLADCFRNQLNCNLSKKLIKEHYINESYFYRPYIIVEPYNVGGYSAFVHNFLVNATNLNVGESVGCGLNSECEDANTKCVKSRCIRSYTNYHAAVDPALVFNYEDKFWQINNTALTKTNLYTQSTYKNQNITIYREESRFIAWLMFISGCAVLAFSIITSVISYRYIRKKFKIL